MLQTSHRRTKRPGELELSTRCRTRRRNLRQARCASSQREADEVLHAWCGRVGQDPVRVSVRIFDCLATSGSLGWLSVATTNSSLAALKPRTAAAAEARPQPSGGH